MKFRLLFDKDQQQYAEEKLLPLVEDIISRHEIYGPEILNGLKPEESVLLYLSDEQLKDALPGLAGTGIKVAVLPHPEANETCVGMGVDRNLVKTIAHLKSDPDPINADILYCNEIPIFNHMVIGHTFLLTSEESSKDKGFWSRLFNPVIHFFNIRLFRVDVNLPYDKKIKTSVAGIVVSEHRKSSFISSRVLEDSSISDGKIHAFLLSPRSVVEMFQYIISSLWGKKKMPRFGAHIKTTKIGLSFPGGAKEYLIDRKKFSTQEIELHIGEKQIEIYPGSSLELPETGKDTTEIYKVNALPTGEAAQVLSEQKLPFIRHASSEEFKGLFQVLRNNARLSSSYLVLMVLSTLLATIGLIANSTPVVIGAMILAPLMAPIISLSMGTLRQDKKLMANSIITILAGLGLSMVFAVFITWLIPVQSAGTEILVRTRPNLLDLGIAVVSGIAGAYAHAREEVAKTLAGVAIAVALIPPLCVAAIGIGWTDWNIFIGATLLLFTNLAGMVLAASVTFMLLGFSPLRLASKGMIISLLLVLVLSIPLALGFNQMVYEQKITQQLEGLKTEFAVIKDVRVQKLDPMKISIKLVSENPIGEYEIDRIKLLIEENMACDVEIEVITAILRI
ncbi:MAG: TIGR00341 family protein [Bacteroidales bacterium]|nr:TIGR00341 family protein [Bacteroidales bacterium]